MSRTGFGRRCNAGSQAPLPPAGELRDQRTSKSLSFGWFSWHKRSRQSPMQVPAWNLSGTWFQSSNDTVITFSGANCMSPPGCGRPPRWLNMCLERHGQRMHALFSSRVIDAALIVLDHAVITRGRRCWRSRFQRPWFWARLAGQEAAWAERPGRLRWNGLLCDPLGELCGESRWLRRHRRLRLGGLPAMPLFVPAPHLPQRSPSGRRARRDGFVAPAVAGSAAATLPGPSAAGRRERSLVNQGRLAFHVIQSLKIQDNEGQLNNQQALRAPR
jgi:hypothetical protein